MLCRKKCIPSYWLFLFEIFFPCRNIYRLVCFISNFFTFFNFWLVLLYYKCEKSCLDKSAIKFISYTELFVEILDIVDTFSHFEAYTLITINIKVFIIYLSIFRKEKFEKE